MNQKDKNYTELRSVRLQNEGSTQQIPVNGLLTIESAFINMDQYMAENDNEFLIRIKNKSRISVIDLSHISPYVLLFFDEELKFKGATYSINTTQGNYSIQTQFNYILFIRFPHNLSLDKLEGIKLSKQ